MVSTTVDPIVYGARSLQKDNPPPLVTSSMLWRFTPAQAFYVALPKINDGITATQMCFSSEIITRIVVCRGDGVKGTKTKNAGTAAVYINNRALFACKAQGTMMHTRPLQAQALLTELTSREPRHGVPSTSVIPRGGA